MLAIQSITEEIEELKHSRRAIILAHHYQDAEIQELADGVADSLELARKARDFEGDVIAFCGVWFMAETAKVINPDRMVVVPDKDAGCSLVDSCPVEELRAWKLREPRTRHRFLHINTSVEVKAESDILCTSRNAVKIVNSIPRRTSRGGGGGVLFLPDLNLGNYVRKQTGRENMKIWQGACIVHATFPARRVIKARAEHPRALVAAHPECPSDVLAGWRISSAQPRPSSIGAPLRMTEEFIIMTESGIRHSLEKLSPGKKFYFVRNEQCNCSECPYVMKLQYAYEKLCATRCAIWSRAWNCRRN